MLEVHWVMSGNEVIWFDAQSAGTNASSKQTGARDDRRHRIISSQGDWSVFTERRPREWKAGRKDKREKEEVGRCSSHRLTSGEAPNGLRSQQGRGWPGCKAAVRTVAEGCSVLLVGHHWVLDVVHVNSGCHFVVVVVVKGCLDIYSGRLNSTTRSSQ